MLCRYTGSFAHERVEEARFFATPRKSELMRFDMLGPEPILDGSATDAYFLRTEDALESSGRNPRVTLEVTVDQFPTGEPDLFAGVKDIAHLLAGKPVDAYALREGRAFDGGPVMRIEGPYLDIARYETSLLGFLSQATGFATRAFEARRTSPDTQLMSFGARHVHPAIAPVVERSALLAGFDGFSHVASGELLGRDASGTMPHALVLCFGRDNQEAAWRAFHEAVDATVPRVLLCDTFGDEVEEVLRAADALGPDLDSVRIDTTSSRRGNFRDILREVRWELDARGFEDVDIFASGGIDTTALDRLGDVVDGFGIGGYITDADPTEFALDIVAVDGTPISKRGKLSGPKQVYRLPSGEHRIRSTSAEASSSENPLLEPLLEDGDIVRAFDLDRAIERAHSERDVFAKMSADD